MTTEPEPIGHIGANELREAQQDPEVHALWREADELLAKLKREGRNVEWTPEDGDSA